MIVYIAAPYTKGDVARNVRRVIATADLLLKMGHIPYVPHLTHFWHIISPKPYEVWTMLDLTFLPFCDVVLRLDGESSGADNEVKKAVELGIPIYYDVKDLAEIK